MKKIKFSIIIPVIEINDYLQESIPKILKLNNKNFEIIILPNKKTSISWPKTRIIPTRFSNPSKKRNLGVEKSKGEIIAFIDDDAYPEKDWLDKALKHFNKKEIVAVGGPAVTPKNDSILQKASGAMSESMIGGGNARKRFVPVGKKHLVDDWPTVNLFVKKDIFIKSGGFDPKYWPGEDTKLCLELLKYGEINYDPDIIVYHHRRASLIKHLKQNGNYGLHRGHFARLYPKNSLKIFYFIPSLFVFYLFILIIVIFLNLFKIYNFDYRVNYLLFPLYFYMLLILLDIILISIRHKNILVGMATIPYIVGTHLYYGIRFKIGYFSKNIERVTHSKKSQ